MALRGKERSDGDGRGGNMSEINYNAERQINEESEDKEDGTGPWDWIHIRGRLGQIESASSEAAR